MTAMFRVLFDENSGPAAVEAVRRVVALDRRHPCEVAHTVVLFGRGAKDAEWIPRVQEGGWWLITQDRGRNSQVGERLPVLCRALGVPHVLVLPALLRRGGLFEQTRGLLAVWPELRAQAEFGRTGRWRLKYAGASCTAFRLEEVAAPASA